MKAFKLILAAGLLAATACLAQQPAGLEWELDTRNAQATVQPTMYGLFFEDINFGADGGLYAELVKNRSFDFPQHLMGWYTFGQVELLDADPPFPNNPTYVKLSPATHHEKATGIENEGFRGMGFRQGEDYRFTVWGKVPIDNAPQSIRIELIDSHNNIAARANVAIAGNEWKRYETVLRSNTTDPHGRLRIFLQSGGDVCLEHVSLFPVNTWKRRENGLRQDLAQALADINPGVLRFPGGCIVEGTELADRYQWKHTVGPVENRPVNKNRWEYTFKDRYFPDYYQSGGLGFYEYFLLAEDIGAEPLPILNVGLVCQYQNPNPSAHAAVDSLRPYIQDAIDLIEFANGDTSTTWGKLRSHMGHSAPFNLKFIGIGNEQWSELYVERLAPFVEAIRDQYPDIQIVGSAGPSADGKDFDYLWPEMKRLKVDLVDEHYYKDPSWFVTNATRYDHYDRQGPAVFAGEYACHDHEVGKQNTFRSALYEAAFMTGLERNADIVHMCTYAPLLAHVDAWQWKPDMIWFDNLSLVKTPNYYVQQLYACNKGTEVMPLTWAGKPIIGQEGLYASAVYDNKQRCYIIKTVNLRPQARQLHIALKGLKRGIALTIGECLLLQADEMTQTNSLEMPDNIQPCLTGACFVDRNNLVATLPGQSFAVYKIMLKK